MILVDTSVWIEHLRKGSDRLSALLTTGAVVCHPFVIGELACGTLRARSTLLSLLAKLPTATMATHGEVLAFIEARQLMGRGLGYVDLHLLASATLDHMPLWTRDKRLATVSREIGAGAG